MISTCSKDSYDMIETFSKIENNNILKFTILQNKNDVQNKQLCSIEKKQEYGDNSFLDDRGYVPLTRNQLSK